MSGSSRFDFAAAVAAWRRSRQAIMAAVFPSISISFLLPGFNLVVSPSFPPLRVFVRYVCVKNDGVRGSYVSEEFTSVFVLVVVESRGAAGAAVFATFSYITAFSEGG